MIHKVKHCFISILIISKINITKQTCNKTHKINIWLYSILNCIMILRIPLKSTYSHTFIQQLFPNSVYQKPFIHLKGLFEPAHILLSYLHL